MNDLDNGELIARAAAVLNPVWVKDRLFGDVGAAVLSKAGEVFTGVAVDTAGWGLCAERSALAAMITGIARSSSAGVICPAHGDGPQ